MGANARGRPRLDARKREAIEQAMLEVLTVRVVEEPHRARKGPADADNVSEAARLSAKLFRKLGLRRGYSAKTIENTYREGPYELALDPFSGDELLALRVAASILAVTSSPASARELHAWLRSRHRVGIKTVPHAFDIAIAFHENRKSPI
jgi:hypothetical protein